MRRIKHLLLAALLASTSVADARTIVLTPSNSGAYITPPQWNEASNTATCIGGGGSGSGGHRFSSTGGSGGGAGASDNIVNLAMEGLVNISVGAGGPAVGALTDGTLGGNTILDPWSVHSSCGARGSQATARGGIVGTGGNTGLGQGTAYGGANGGLGGADTGGTGGCSTTCAGGGGAGGSGSSGSGANGSQYSSGTGGTGAQGDNGTGGIGGIAGANGSDGTEIGGAGAGGGGGGGSTGANGGNGGKCGSGGGGAGDASSGGGAGGDGCIILQDTPTTDTTLGYHGSATATFNDNSGNLSCHSWTAPITGIGTTLFFSPNISVTGDVVFGVYDSTNIANTYYPGVPLAQTAQIVNPASGLQSDALNASVLLTQGNLYWLCVLVSSTIHWNAGPLQENNVQFTQSYTSSMPSVKSATSSGVAIPNRPILYVGLTPPPAGHFNPMSTP